MRAVTIFEVSLWYGEVSRARFIGEATQDIELVMFRIDRKLGDRLGNKDVNLVPGH